MGSELGRRLPAAPNGAWPFANTPATQLDMILPVSSAIKCFEYILDDNTNISENVTCKMSAIWFSRRCIIRNDYNITVTS